MLVEFRAKNFRSLREEQSLSFIASTDESLAETHCIETDVRSVPRLTRANVIYGANASGKSNLIFALATMRNMMLGSTSMPEAAFAEQYTPFLLDRASAKEPTELELTVLLDGVRYQYGFSYDAQRIRDEWLIVYKTGKGQGWFDRSWNAAANDYEWAPFSTHFMGQKDVWRKATRPQALFLTTAAQLNSEQLKPLLNWINGSVTILNRLGAVPHAPELLWPTLRRLEEPGFKERALSLLRAADIHIADIRVEKHPGQQFELKMEPGKSPEFATRPQEIPIVKYMHCVKGEVPVWFDNRYESFGTQKLMAIVGPIFDAVDNGKLLVVDELDSSLHPLMMRFLLGLVHDADLSKRGAQLWITTHDTTLLDTDLLRRDQIWFVEKGESQASRLYPLSDFSPRKNEALERGYLRGRYGGVPFLSRLNVH